MTLNDEEIDALACDLGPLLSPPPAQVDDESEDDARMALLVRYHAGTLDGDELAAAEGLLAADPAARAFIEELEQAPSTFRAAWATKHGLAAVKRPGPPKFVWRGGILAMAAAVALFVGQFGGPPRAPTEAPPGYGITLVRGAQKPVRGPAGEPPAKRFRVDDAITLTLALAPEDTPADGLQVRAFVDAADGTLTVAGAQGVLGGGGGWRIEAPSRALFGERYGVRALHVAFAYDGERFDDLEGQTPGDAKADGQLRWVSVTFEYVPEGAGEEGGR